ncbi:hypothetical protein BD560DRAFT_491028 [Blakeslea trispora]|nr:hypothetical protein BD560DRAFT_491028 [Blakeslea trispora]
MMRYLFFVNKLLGGSMYLGTTNEDIFTQGPPTVRQSHCSYGSWACWTLPSEELLLVTRLPKRCSMPYSLEMGCSISLGVFHITGEGVRLTLLGTLLSRCWNDLCVIVLSQFFENWCLHLNFTRDLFSPDFWSQANFHLLVVDSVNQSKFAFTLRTERSSLLKK